MWTEDISDNFNATQLAEILLHRLLRDAHDARSDTRPDARFLQSYIKLRRFRERLFPKGVFADPAWDILMDLYIAESENKAISVSSACIAAAVPPTTALRWIDRLEQEGLIRRHRPAGKNRRRVILSLEPHARRAIEDWSRHAISALPPFGQSTS